MPSARHTPHIYSLEQAAGAAPALAALIERSRRSASLLEQLRPRIPPGLRAHIQPGPLDDGEWCLLVTNPAAATKLRHLTPLLLQDLSQIATEVTSIRVKVQARVR
ncbi:MAG: DUF721 domain-containing protein [Hydrogenophaga sp.]|jgi:hypothetical protein|nr:DUF721 domain-containing protein [Hydrogenophaga sp.]